MTETALHPTKQTLINSTIELLESHAVHEVTIEQVLQKSQISVGSVYHHFKDFPELMDHALVSKYAKFTQINVDLMAQVLAESKNSKEYKKKILKLLEFTHSATNAEMRKARTYILSQATVRPGLGELMVMVQSNLTRQLAEIIGEAQSRGWVQPRINPKIIATFIQSYGVGRIVDDLTNPQMDNDEWIDFIKHMISLAVLVG